MDTTNRQRWVGVMGILGSLLAARVAVGIFLFVYPSAPVRMEAVRAFPEVSLVYFSGSFIVIGCCLAASSALAAGCRYALLYIMGALVLCLASFHCVFLSWYLGLVYPAMGSAIAGITGLVLQGILVETVTLTVMLGILVAQSLRKSSPSTRGKTSPG